MYVQLEEEKIIRQSTSKLTKPGAIFKNTKCTLSTKKIIKLLLLTVFMGIRTKVYFRSIIHLYSVCIYQGLFPLYILTLLCVYLPRFISALYFISTLCVSTKVYFRSIFHLYSVRIYQGLFPLYISSLLCAYIP